ncbi:MAG TPA: TetR family transcriptional regulator [Micromonosporaceae bacterium]|nr:TetR family transcriptional regulator [Micromonosporaceae bacterium]
MDGLRELKKRRTRAAIQEHALRLFEAQGYDATTVEQIAAAAEVSPATFFRYFKTKEDVVIEDDYDPLLAAALEKAPADLPPLRAIRYALREAFTEITPEEMEQVLSRTKLIMSVPALRARSLENLLATIDAVAPPLAARLGRPVSDRTVRVLVGAAVGAWLTVILEWLASDGATDLPTLMDSALAALDDGLRDPLRRS